MTNCELLLEYIDDLYCTESIYRCLIVCEHENDVDMMSDMLIRAEYPVGHRVYVTECSKNSIAHLLNHHNIFADISHVICVGTESYVCVMEPDVRSMFLYPDVDIIWV